MPFLPGKHAVRAVELIARGWASLAVFGVLAAACGGSAFTSGEGPPDGSAGNGSAGTASAGGSNGAGGGGTGGSIGLGGAAGTASMDAGMGGAGGRAGGGGASGADAGSCPAALPGTSQPCSPEGLSCTYGKCCPTHAICSGGKWEIAITDCAVPGCPPAAPASGAACTCVSTPIPCHYECAITGKSIDATCVNDVWTTHTSACAAVPCGQSMCMPGQICLKKTSGAGEFYQCSNNPCGTSALACTCAASLCPMGNVCSASGTTLTCTCPQCV